MHHHVANVEEAQVLAALLVVDRGSVDALGRQPRVGVHRRQACDRSKIKAIAARSRRWHQDQGDGSGCIGHW
jgi:hypothetical protein